jgi:predicted phosphohydrolase
MCCVCEKFLETFFIASSLFSLLSPRVFVFHIKSCFSVESANIYCATFKKTNKKIFTQQILKLEKHTQAHIQQQKNQNKIVINFVPFHLPHTFHKFCSAFTFECIFNHIEMKLIRFFPALSFSLFTPD